MNKLSSLEERATQLSMEDVKVLEKSDILTLEPYCKFDNALHVPQAGVVDYGVVTKKLASTSKNAAKLYIHNGFSSFQSIKIFL